MSDLNLACLTPRMSREQTASPFASRATEGSALDSLVRHFSLTSRRDRRYIPCQVLNTPLLAD
jgi:hypothetical protein